MSTYIAEYVDRLPHGSEAKARRYATERYEGAAGLNWYDCDPTLQFILRNHLTASELDWATPYLHEVGALMAGPINEYAEQTDKNPPRLERYDRWGHDVSEVVMPASFHASREQLLAHSFTSPEFAQKAAIAGIHNVAPLVAARSYLLNQADIGMTCALGTGGDMVLRLAEQYAPGEAQVRVKEVLAEGQLTGETAQLMTERTGGSDLAALETTARRDGSTWLLNGFKWFVSNVNGSAYVVLAKPEGAEDGVRGIVPFLVMRERSDGSRNGIRIRRLKNKLGTNSVASAEVELVDAEAFMLAPFDEQPGGERAGQGRGLARMMELTNDSRMGVSMMGLGCARRALVESLTYAAAREAFGKRLDDQPLMQRKLAELIVETEAAQALVFDGQIGAQLRLGVPLIKLKAARLGITAASDAIEIHGGNGYIEQWPVARILRDAQVNTVWEGADNVLCLDVRRAITREEAHLPLFARIQDAISSSGGDGKTTELVAQRLERVAEALDRWRTLDPMVAEARLFPLAQHMSGVYAAALLLEQAGSSAAAGDSGRKALVARLYARTHLAPSDPLTDMETEARELDQWDLLRSGALAD
ncbi:DNA alkylation response protein [Epidermidibacterium keratini]|uniref:DNA alkylation response protein n=1 Tax=Epidermidibacterium keratini TaxID=1891644 RepID=A0A7L4YS04_9ACTN|nr:acyl-CoA dehydrogenase family protein [Epidermidibacterium keratini]QHC02031.1 DNA alkylation response protein [Epidermidibacterium keratini]